MEIITKGGNVITCTPEEYAKMVQLGVMPGSGSGTPGTPPWAAPGSSPDTTAQHPDISWKARPNPEVPGKVLFEYGNIQKLPDDISIGNIQKLPDDIVPLPEGGSSWKKTIEVEPYSAVEKLPDGTTKIKSTDCDASIAGIRKQYSDFMDNLKRKGNQQ